MTKTGVRFYFCLIHAGINCCVPVNLHYPLSEWSNHSLDEVADLALQRVFGLLLCQFLVFLKSKTYNISKEHSLKHAFPPSLNSYDVDEYVIEVAIRVVLKSTCSFIFEFCCCS